MRSISADTFTHKNCVFTLEVSHDDNHEPPWGASEGHGPVRGEYVPYGDVKKRPGERVLHKDRGNIMLYDFEEATKIAKSDGWGLGADALAALERAKGRKPTRAEIAREAVIRDFNWIRDWLHDRWFYGVLCVTLIRVGDYELDEDERVTSYIGGVESDDRGTIEECKIELARELLHRIRGDMVLMMHKVVAERGTTVSL